MRGSPFAIPSNALSTCHHIAAIHPHLQQNAGRRGEFWRCWWQLYSTTCTITCKHNPHISTKTRVPITCLSSSQAEQEERLRTPASPPSDWVPVVVIKRQCMCGSLHEALARAIEMRRSNGRRWAAKFVDRVSHALQPQGRVCLDLREKGVGVDST